MNLEELREKTQELGEAGAFNGNEFKVVKSAERSCYALAAKRLTGGNPKYVQVPIKPEGRAKRCHHNVMDKIAREGCGERVVGWSMKIVGKDSNTGCYVMSCELHSVYQTPDGDLIDVTPHPEYADATHDFFCIVDLNTFTSEQREWNRKLLLNGNRSLLLDRKRILWDIPA